MKLYNVSGGMKLHDARRVLGVRVIAHTGRVNAYARCMGTAIKADHPKSRAAAAASMVKHAAGCKGK